MSDEDVLARLEALTAPDAAPDPSLAAGLAALDDITNIVEAGHLLRDIPADRLNDPGRTTRGLRIGIAATFTAEAVEPVLRLALTAVAIAPEIHVTPFDQLLVELTDPESALAAFAPDVTLCLLDERAFLPQDWDRVDPASLAGVLQDRTSVLEQALAAYTARTSGSVLLHTVPLPMTEFRSVIGFRGRAALGRVWRDLNSGLLDLSERHTAVYTLDLEILLTDHPGKLRDDRLHSFASMAWTPEVEAAYAREAAAFCRAVVGRSRKVLVLDADNTLWGGIIGDDGIDGIQLGGTYPGGCYSRVQRTAQALREQGVLLAMASKNDAAVVDRALDGHPEMVLRAADFAVREVNWESKDGSLRRIAKTLDLGLDSLVFADDSRFETDLVRSALPEVAVLHLAGDPSDHVAALLADRHFDVLATTITDAERTELYRSKAERASLAESFASAEDYLRNLELRVTVRPADAFSLPRLVQLGLRTNQFNMVGRAHSEAQTRVMADSPDHLVLGFTVEDRFGSEGIVGGVWIDAASPDWLIENFVMSCRVFSRGIERAVLQAVVDRAIAAGARQLVGVYLRTDRNAPAARLYPEAGFEAEGEADGTARLVLSLDPHPKLCPDWIVIVEEGEPDHA